jgi:hypothetical protein
MEEVWGKEVEKKKKKMKWKRDEGTRRGGREDQKENTLTNGGRDASNLWTRG